MKVKLFAVLAALLMACAIAIPASAQELTNDVIFLRVGYIPAYTVSFDGEIAGQSIDDSEFAGFAGMAEYNLNLNPVLIGFGIEYQRVVDDADEAGADDSVASFLIPQVTAKFMTAGGFYIGAGLAGKYLIGYDFGEGVDTDKTIDLWLNGVIGYMATISEGIYLDVSGRFGLNLTNSTFDEIETTLGKTKYDASSAYDIAIYVGIGFKSFATGM
ncbi:MAG: hypothetical protein KBA61_18995 [Spirochaetes bacterium]|nr:hypothetical protein [Spirochaetota bacterium]